METCLLQHFILNSDLKDSCDFNTGILDEGPGIYEVFRVINGTPLFLEEHIKRFYTSAFYEQFSDPISEQQLMVSLKNLIETNSLKQGNIRFQYLIHPSRGPVFMAWIVPTIYPSKSDYESGVDIVTLNASRKRPHSKRTNLPLRQLAEEIIEEDRVAEVLLINKKGLVTEGHRSNIFFVGDNTLHTSPVELVLPGITRDKIIALAKREGIPVIEKDIESKDLTDFDACFLSSTSKNVLPIHRIDEIDYKAKNPITTKLALLFDKLVNDHLGKFSWV